MVLRPSSTLAQPIAILATLTQFSALGTEGTCGAVWSLLSFPISKLQWSQRFLVPNLAGCAYVSCPRKRTHTQAFSDSLGWIVLPRDFQQLCFHPRMAVTKRGFAVPMNSEEKMKRRASSKLPCGRFPSEASLPPSSPNHETAPVWFPGLCSCSWFYTSSWMQSSMVYTEMAGLTPLRSFYLNWPSWVSHQVINCFCAVVAGYARWANRQT